MAAKLSSIGFVRRERMVQLYGHVRSPVRGSGIRESRIAYRSARVDSRPGTYRLGPDDGTLSVRTGRTGAAAKAGHDLLIHVTAWEATLRGRRRSRRHELELAADAASLRVSEGTGGMQSLGDDDKANIQKTIDDDVLKRQAITFRSTAVTRPPTARSAWRAS